MNIEVVLAVILQIISVLQALSNLIGFNLPLFEFGGGDN
jgi:hypothetical protein